MLLSQQRPYNERKLNHIKQGTAPEPLYFPEGTYGYTAHENLVIAFNKQVSIEAFWIRLHRHPNKDYLVTEGTRLVQIFSKGMVVAQATFYLTSYDWVLIKPEEGFNAIVGDTLAL